MKRRFLPIMARIGTLHLLWSTSCGAPGEATGGFTGLAEPAWAHYLANAGVLIASGDTKVVFDPLFRNDFGTYRLLPEELESALPWSAPRLRSACISRRPHDLAPALGGIPERVLDFLQPVPQLSRAVILAGSVLAPLEKAPHRSRAGSENLFLERVKTGKIAR